MNWRLYLLLFFLGLGVASAVAALQDMPGYLDSDYYFAGGLQLVKGDGFNEPYLWNYLDDPAGLPHPSHTYWLPLSSILAALSMAVFGQHTYSAARLVFILIAACIPPLTARLAKNYNGNRRTLALTSGLFAVFSIYHAPFMPVTDNFAPFMLLGGLLFLIMEYNRWWAFLIMGLLAGLLNFARSDGLMWLGLLGLLLIWQAMETAEPEKICWRYVLRILNKALHAYILVIIGYLFVMAPWYARNLSIFGSPLAPGGERILWLTNYNDTFAFPAARVNMQSWLAMGWNSALKTRLWALGMNAKNAIGAQGGLVLFPFILIGLWQVRRDLRVKLAITGWIILLFVMTLLFPFAGARGGFFHAGVAFQPLWWSLAPVGLEHAVAVTRRKGLFDERAYDIFRWAMVGICALLTVVVIQMRLFQLGWQVEEELYIKVEEFLVEQGAQPDEIVVTLNPPGYYIVSGRSCIVMPPGGADTILALASQYGASYFVLERNGVLPEYKELYEQTREYAGIKYLGEVGDARIFLLSASE